MSQNKKDKNENKQDNKLIMLIIGLLLIIKPELLMFNF